MVTRCVRQALHSYSLDGSMLASTDRYLVGASSPQSILQREDAQRHRENIAPESLPLPGTRVTGMSEGADSSRAESLICHEFPLWPEDVSMTQILTRKHDSGQPLKY